MTETSAREGSATAARDDKLPTRFIVHRHQRRDDAAAHRTRAAFPGKDFENWTRPKVSENDHWQQFVEACAATARPGQLRLRRPLTESVLLGSVATRFPKTTMQWDAKKLKFTNVSDANQYLPDITQRWRSKAVVKRREFIQRTSSAPRRFGLRAAAQPATNLR